MRHFQWFSGVAFTSLWELILYLASQLHAQWCHISTLKLAIVGVLNTTKISKHYKSGFCLFPAKIFYQHIIAFTLVWTSFRLECLILLPCLDKAHPLCVFIESCSVHITILNTLYFKNLFTCLHIMLSCKPQCVCHVHSCIHAYHI